MPATLSRQQVGVVVAAYAAVALISALLIFERYLVYVRNPQDVAAAGGMYAGGDLLLEIMICFLFFAPTALLVFFIRKSESAFTTYAKILLGFSITAPLSLALMFAPFMNQWYWGDAIVFRLFAVPFDVVVLILSRLLTRYARARRLITWAMLIEGLTFIAAVGSLFFLSRSHG